MDNRSGLIRIIALATFIFSPPLAAKPLTAQEKLIAEHITQQASNQLSLLEKIANINSDTANVAGVRQVGSVLRPEFEQLGFKVRWVEEPAEMKRAPTLVAERKGNSGKRVLLIGHLDTVFSKDSPFQTFTRVGDKARGPGVIDDKGGDVIILYALKALAAAHVLDNTTITVVLTGDEEDSGKPAAISRKPLFEAARQSDIALDFECAITADTATIARRGISQWTVKTTGNETHSSEIFRKVSGYGANFELARILNTMVSRLASEKYLSFNPGLILGGTIVGYDKQLSSGKAFGKENVIAKTALAKGDLRYLTPVQRDHAKAAMKQIVKTNLPGTTAEISFEDGIPSMPPTAENIRLLEVYSQASDDLGYGKVKALDPGIRGAGDISYIAGIVKANLVGLGALGNGAHSTDETLDIKSLPIQTQRAALLIYRLTHS
ncbi:M20/M25/M40 family metallo-hydrolase [Legionella dresdenensis]|uniref:M20/M25/M40 family metallo-hydrolase n=1 Tax=Legionella dresdenensis TaxID=450200 RepID=A0ABV8CCM7_9GAMM